MTLMTSGIAKKNGGTPEGARQGNHNMLNIFGSEEKSNPRSVENIIYESTSAFDKKLRWMIENPSKDGLKMKITPKMAEVMLGWNIQNRPLAESTVKKYAAVMRAGRWQYTGETIIFSKSRLMNGQHRLEACVASGVAFDVLVVFGAPDPAFAFMDVGKTRTASNIFAIHSVPNHAVMAAAVQWVLGYETGAIGSAVKGTYGKDHAELYEGYLKHPKLQDSAWVAHLFAKRRIVSPSMMCAIHYVCARKAQGEADTFFRKVAEGIGFNGKKDPAYKLNKTIVDRAVAQDQLGRKAAAAITIKAWNASRLSRDVGALKFEADEVFPKVI
jgi:hypothetical protein